MGSAVSRISKFTKHDMAGLLSSAHAWENLRAKFYKQQRQPEMAQECLLRATDYARALDEHLDRTGKG